VNTTLGIPRAFLLRSTRDYGPSPCERRYRLLGWTLLHRLLRPLCPSPRLVTQPTYPLQEVAVRFRRSSHSNLPADLGPLQIPYTWTNQARDLNREVHEVLAAPFDSQPEPQVAGQSVRLLSHSACLPHHLVTVGVFYGQDLGFDNNRLTVSASVTSSYWECNSPASLARFPCKLDLMPIRCGLCNELRQG